MKKKHRTKIFCDSADINVIKKLNNHNLVYGFTTNPSLMKKFGAKNYQEYSKKILKICKKKPISFEVISDNFQEIEEQAYKINTWGKNVFVKIFLKRFSVIPELLVICLDSLLKKNCCIYIH